MLTEGLLSFHYSVCNHEDCIVASRADVRSRRRTHVRSRRVYVARKFPSANLGSLLYFLITEKYLNFQLAVDDQPFHTLTL